jgi:hypothetical protein
METKLKRRPAWRVVVLLVGLLAMVAAGCGGAASTAGLGSGERAGGDGDGANVTVLLDGTTARSSRKMAADLKHAALRLADPVLNTGGHLRVALFAGAGVAPAVLVDDEVARVEELMGNARKRFLISARANLAALLDQALGLQPVAPDSPLAGQLEAMPRGGSDLAGALQHEAALLQERGGGTLRGLSDGLQRSPGIDFSGTIARMSVAEAAEALAPLMPTDAASVAVEIGGVGVSGNGGQVSTERARRLTEAWTAACEAATVRTCAVRTSLP